MYSLTKQWLKPGDLAFHDTCVRNIVPSKSGEEGSDIRHTRGQKRVRVWLATQGSRVECTSKAENDWERKPCSM